MWYGLFTLIKKELQALLTNPNSLRILILPVIIQVLVFPFAATMEVKNASLAIYNQDNGAPAIELVQRLSSNQAFTKVHMIYSEAALKRVIDQQDVLLAIRIPMDFSRRLLSGQSPQLQTIMDGRHSNSAQIASAYVQQIVQDFALDNAPQTSPGQLIVQNLYNPNMDYHWFILPSLVAIIATIGGLMVSALSLAREREEGTFDQLLVSPLTPGYIIAGKAIPSVLVAILQGTIIAIVAVYIYRIPFTGSVWVLYLSMICYGLALSGFGLLISAFCANQQQAFFGAFGFAAPAIILSGYLTPVENMPPFLRFISQIDPVTHFIVLSKGLFLKGYGLAEALNHLVPLILIAIVTLTLAYWVFRSRSGQ